MIEEAIGLEPGRLGRSHAGPPYFALISQQDPRRLERRIDAREPKPRPQERTYFACDLHLLGAGGSGSGQRGETMVGFGGGRGGLRSRFRLESRCERPVQ
jgi:hypothetical protein